MKFRLARTPSRLGVPSPIFRILCLAFGLAAATATVLTLGSNRALASSHAVVDTTAPTGGAVTSSMGDFSSYRIGDRIPFAVTFSENVQITGSPRLVVHLDSGDVYADYDPAAHGSNWLQFIYWIAPGDVSDGITVDNAVDVSGGTIQDAAGNDATFAPGVYDRPGIGIAAGIPAVTSVDVPAAGTYKAGDALNFTVHFTHPVGMSGGPASLMLDIGGRSVEANYSGGYGPTAMTFRYIVEDDYSDPDGITVTELDPAGYLKDAASGTIDAERALNGVGSTANVLVDSIAPNVDSVDVPAAGTYGVGDELALVVHFNENVNVNTTGGGRPALFFQLPSGWHAQAPYVSGSGSSELTFRYTVQAGDASDGGLGIQPYFAYTGMTCCQVTDEAGNQADQALNGVGDDSDVLIVTTDDATEATGFGDAPADAPTPTPAPVDATPAPLDLTPPTKPANPAAKVTGGQLQISFGSSTDNAAAVGYRLVHDGTAIATVDGNSFKLPLSIITKPGTMVLQLRALDAAGNQSDPVMLTLTRLSAPKTTPKVLPGWAWKLAHWQQAPKATRGARPHTPANLPKWYGKWNAWHKAPVTATVS